MIRARERPPHVGGAKQLRLVTAIVTGTADAQGGVGISNVNLDRQRGVRQVGGVDRGLAMPARDLDGELVAGLGTQPSASRVDHRSTHVVA